MNPDERISFIYSGLLIFGVIEYGEIQRFDVTYVK